MVYMYVCTCVNLYTPYVLLLSARFFRHIILLWEYLLLLQPIVAEARTHSAAGAPSVPSANSR